MVIKGENSNGFTPIAVAAVVFAILVIGGTLFFVRSGMISPKKPAQQNSQEYNLMPSQQSQQNGQNDVVAAANTDEKQMGFIKKVYEENGKKYLDIDYAQMLDGDAALKAIQEDGKCPADIYLDPSYCIPNGYYIRNQNPQIRTFEVSNSADVSRLGIYDLDGLGSDVTVQVTFEEFKNLLMNNSQYSNSYMKVIPFWIFIKNGIVEKIEQQYIP